MPVRLAAGKLARTAAGTFLSMDENLKSHEESLPDGSRSLKRTCSGAEHVVRCRALMAR